MPLNYFKKTITRTHIQRCRPPDKRGNKNNDNKQNAREETNKKNDNNKQNVKEERNQK